MTSDETRLNEALAAAGDTPVRDGPGRSDPLQLGQASAVPHRSCRRCTGTGPKSGRCSRSRWALQMLGDDAAGPDGRGAPVFLREKFLRVAGRLQRRELPHRRDRCGVRVSGGQRADVPDAAACAHHLVGIEKSFPLRAPGSVPATAAAVATASASSVQPIWTGVTPGDGPEEFHHLSKRPHACRRRGARSLHVSAAGLPQPCPVTGRREATPKVNLQRPIGGS